MENLMGMTSRNAASGGDFFANMEGFQAEIVEYSAKVNSQCLRQNAGFIRPDVYEGLLRHKKLSNKCVESKLHGGWEKVKPVNISGYEFFGLQNNYV